MFKHYLWGAFAVVAGVIAYLDSSGMLHFLPEKFAVLIPLVAIANIVIQQLRRTQVDKPDAGDNP